MRTWVLILAIVASANVAYASAPSLARARAELRAAEAEVARHLQSPDADPTAALRTEKALETADAALRKARSDLGAALSEEIQALADRMKAALPRLKTGTIDARREAARRVQRWRAAYAELQAERAELGSSDAGRWAEHLAGVDPLDGPEELREKADFVEDARDKLRSKRKALLAMLDDRQRRTRLARTARSFSTDAQLFDEQVRPGRILSDGRRSALLDGSEQSDAVNAPPFNAGNPSPPEDPSASPGNQSGGRDGPGMGVTDPAVDGATVEGSGFNRGVTSPEAFSQHGSGGPSADPSPNPNPPTSEGLTPARELGPALGLDLVELGEDASPAQLEAWLKRLERADRELANRRQALLRRARQLEE